MASRRTTAPRKRSASPLVTAPIAPAAAGDVSQEVVVDQAGIPDPDELARDLLSQIDGMLREEPSLGERDREAFGQMFAQSLREVVASGAHLQLPSEVEWQEVLSSFKRDAAATEGASDELVRMLGGALESLEQKQTKIAFEFSRRMQTDGQESALAWLKQQQQGIETNSSDSSGSNTLSESKPSAMRTEVTQSRSRRLRGPPKN